MIFEPVSVVALVTHNDHQLRLLIPFQMWLFLPLILTFSNSAVPLPSDDIFQPLRPLAKSLVCKIPQVSLISFHLNSVGVISQPPIDGI